MSVNTNDRGGLGTLGDGFPRPCKLLSLEEFHDDPYRAIVDAAAARMGTLIYTTGAKDESSVIEKKGPGMFECKEVAVVISASHYRELARLADVARDHL